MLAAILMLAQAMQEAPGIPPQRIAEGQVQPQPADLAVGYCLNDGTPFDLRRMWLLEDQTVALDTLDGPLSVTIERDRLLIDEYRANSERTRSIWELGHMLEDERGPLDIQLKLGVWDANLVLYWRETYQNRIYRQGLFKITGTELVPLCEGRGGLVMSH